jgi:hypothetical protein
MFARATAHTCVIEGLRPGVLPEVCLGGALLDWTLIEIYLQAALYLRAGTAEQGRSNRCSCPL